LENDITKLFASADDDVSALQSSLRRQIFAAPNRTHSFSTMIITIIVVKC
jgi:hypothetical protein